MFIFSNIYCSFLLEQVPIGTGIVVLSIGFGLFSSGCAALS